jgi:hypothetical protein
MCSRPKVSDISGTHPPGADNAQQHQAHHDEEAPGFDARHQLGLAHRQQADQDTAAIQRRQREQVESANITRLTSMPAWHIFRKKAR